jgi:hypothetical protein
MTTDTAQMNEIARTLGVAGLLKIGPNPNKSRAYGFRQIARHCTDTALIDTFKAIQAQTNTGTDKHNEADKAVNRLVDLQLGTLHTPPQRKTTNTGSTMTPAQQALSNNSAVQAVHAMGRALSAGIMPAVCQLFASGYGTDTARSVLQEMIDAGTVTLNTVDPLKAAKKARKEAKKAAKKAAKLQAKLQANKDQPVAVTDDTAAIIMRLVLAGFDKAAAEAFVASGQHLKADTSTAQNTRKSTPQEKIDKRIGTLASAKIPTCKPIQASASTKTLVALLFKADGSEQLAPCAHCAKPIEATGGFWSGSKDRQPLAWHHGCKAAEPGQSYRLTMGKRYSNGRQVNYGMTLATPDEATAWYRFLLNSGAISPAIRKAS